MVAIVGRARWSLGNWSRDVVSITDRCLMNGSSWNAISPIRRDAGRGNATEARACTKQRPQHLPGLVTAAPRSSAHGSVAASRNSVYTAAA